MIAKVFFGKQRVILFSEKMACDKTHSHYIYIMEIHYGVNIYYLCVVGSWMSLFVCLFVSLYSPIFLQ